MKELVQGTSNATTIDTVNDTATDNATATDTTKCFN
jgi:hypothetical protein